MMNIIITDSIHTERYSAIEVSNGKQKACIGIGNSGEISIINLNASHRAWKKGGRTFLNWEVAKAAYRSQFMQLAIETAIAKLA